MWQFFNKVVYTKPSMLYKVLQYDPKTYTKKSDHLVSDELDFSQDSEDQQLHHVQNACKKQPR